MPYRSTIAPRLADLLMQQGNIAAERQARSGLTLASLVQGIGQIPRQLQQQRAANEEAMMRRAQLGSRLATEDVQRQNIQGQMDARGYARMDDAAAKDLALSTHKVGEWLTELVGIEDPEQKKQAYVEGRAALLAEGRIAESDAPASFPGQSWVKSRLTMLLPAAERFKAMFPEARAPIQRDPTKDLVNPDTLEVVSPGTPAPERPQAPTPTSLALDAAGGDPMKALQLLRQQNASQAQPDYEWVMRNGTPVQIRKGTAQTGDTPYTAPRSTSETAQDRQRKGRLDSARGFLKRLNELREGINIKIGPQAGLTGLARQGAAAIGLDPDVAEYERVRAAGGRALAVAIMGAQNLSDADAAAWANMLPGARIDKITAKRLTDQIGKMLEDTDTAPGPVTLKTNVADIDAPDAPEAPDGWKYVPKPGGGWTAVEDK